MDKCDASSPICGRNEGVRTAVSLAHAASQGRRWSVWLLRGILGVLFLGPLLAPLLQATRLPLLATAGALARDVLAHYVCPTPARSYALFGFPMAVCARCWGATIGMVLAWVLVRRARPVPDGSPIRRLLAALYPAYLAVPWPVHLMLATLPFLLWYLEIHAWVAVPRALLLMNGANAGFWAGLWLLTLWPGPRIARTC